MEEKPIYNFEKIKKTLASLGYEIEKAQGYREIENVDVDLNDLKNNIEFTDDGIFFTDSTDGSKHQIFLYKRKYRVNTYGKPRYHVRKCKVIQDFINKGSFEKEYRRANTDVVNVLDMDDFNKEKKVDHLPLCKYCANMIFNESLKEIDSTEFVELLKRTSEVEDEKPKNIEVDIFGYTKDWEKVSSDYRESKNYTCERCGLHISNPFDRYYMHTHHKNGDKTNNKESNLECLCIRCHSQVDDIHRHNYSYGANKKILDQFNDDYPE